MRSVAIEDELNSENPLLSMNDGCDFKYDFLSPTPPSEILPNSFVRALPSVHDRIRSKARKFTTESCKCFINEKSSFFVLVFCHAMRISLWIWIFMEMQSTIAHSFAWEALLTPLVALQLRGNCSNISNCLTETVYPLIPILMTSFPLIHGLVISFVLFSEYNVSLSVKLLKRITFLEMIIFFLSAPILCTILIQTARRLRSTMEEQLGPVSNITTRWTITQQTSKCCGVVSFMDWNLYLSSGDNMTYPESCCDTKVGFCSEGFVKASYVWSNGCHSVEHAVLVYYGCMEMFILFFGFIISMFQLCTVKRFAKIIEKRVIKYGDETANRHIFIRQGSNFISINEDGKGRNLINLDEIRIRTEGEIVGTVSVVDSEVCLSICNYDALNDKVNLRREATDSIFITVGRWGAIRGSITISSAAEQLLRSVKVTTNSYGAISIQTREQLYANL